MRRCPKCNRTYQTDTQKFCTHDGGLLFDIDPGLGETVQFDSNKIRDAVAKPTTRDLETKLPAQFDPEATVITPAHEPEASVISSGRRDEATVAVRGRDTGELEPQVTQHQISPPPGVTSGPIPPPPAQSTSGPIAPTQASAPLPPSQPATSGPIGTSAPLAAPQVAPQAPSQPLSAAPANKKSKAPLILGILAVLLFLGLGAVVAAYFVVVRPMLAKRQAERTITTAPALEPANPGLPPTTASPAQASQPPENEPPPYSPPADAVQFVSAQENTSDKLASHHIDFSFYYPNRWEKDPKAGTGESNNFVEVHRQLPPNFTQESMAISWYDSAGSFEADRDSFHSFVEKKSASFAQSIGNYKKVSEGPTKIGIYDGYEFRFEGLSQNTEKGQFKIWGRVVWLPPTNDGKTGATLLMLATSLAPELQTVDDVGQKGELPMLLESFRFGKK
jgi:hypothetical protein